MILGELLQLLRGSILNDRTDRASGTSDYLWEDDTLIAFIDEAQRRFAVRSLILRDGSTAEATEVTLQTGVDTYELHPAVIAVISAKLSDQPADLTRVGHSLLNSYRPPADNWIDPSYFSGLPPGPTLAYSTDEELTYGEGSSLSVINMRVHPVPSAAMNGRTIKLRVVRKPIERLTAANMSATPEIPEDHHLEMLDWAAYLALRIVDDDAGSARRAEEFAQSFESHVREARATAMRKLFSPMPWGFGRGGFSWGS